MSEVVIRRYIRDYLVNNGPARLLAGRLDELGVGFFPLVDHVAVRTLNVDRRAAEFLEMGFAYDAAIGVLEFDDWWAKVYRRPGLPAVFIDQAYDGERGATSLIPAWVRAFGDQVLHHVALRVEDIEVGVARMKALGVAFPDEIIGEAGTDLRQIFTRPEMKDGQPFTVLELIERHRGYAGFLPPQADGLMKSSV